MIVEISTHGSTLKRNHDSFVIINSEEKIEIPAEKVDAILISANSLVSSQAIRLAMEKQIHIVFTSWSGNPFARVWASSQGKATDLRRWQYLNQNSSTGLKVSLDIVVKKLKRQKKFLSELKSNRAKRIQVLDEAIRTFDDVLQKLKNQNMPKDSLLGFEGWCAKKYFEAISTILPRKWKFAERTQHPARDAFNAALNYIYGLGYSSVEKVIILTGLDPNAGFYHADSYGKPTLSYDIMELVRPVMDKSIVSLFTKKQIRVNWFEYQNNAVFLAKNGRIRVITKYIEENKKTVEEEAWNYCRKIIKMFEKKNN
jgi:CRISPR-associated protein Cas1